MTPSTEELLASFGNKPLPMDYDSEQSVISCLLQRPQLCDELPPAEFFHHPVSKMVYAGVLAVIASRLPLDCVTLTRVLREANVLDKCGGAYYITTLQTGGEASAMPGNYPHYLSIISEKFRMRQMIGALAAGIAHLQAFTEVDGVSATGALEHCQKLVCEAVNDDGSSELEYQPIGELVMQVLDDAQAMAESGKTIPGITTGITAIDAIFGGFEEGCLTVVAAESSDGKSSLCRQMLESVAIEGHCAIDFTYEMMPKSEARRMLCSQGRIDAGSLKMGLLTRGEQQALAVQTKKISAWDMHVIDAAGKTIEQICRHIARKSKKMPKGKKIVALIDYIQLCKTAVTSKSREREIAHITSTAKQCAKMTGAHIIMPSQQNKDGEVRESMAIEQDADTLIQIQKIETKSTKKAWEKGKEEDAPNNIRKIFFKKLRDGERYTSVTMELVGRFFRFEMVREPNPN